MTVPLFYLNLLIRSTFKYKIEKFTFHFFFIKVESRFTRSLYIHIMSKFFLVNCFPFLSYFSFQTGIFVMLVLRKESLSSLFMFRDVSKLLILYCPQLALEYCSGV